MVPQILTEEVYVDQVLHGSLTHHVDAQMLPDPAAGTISCNEVVCLDLVWAALWGLYSAADTIRGLLEVVQPVPKSDAVLSSPPVSPGSDQLHQRCGL